jgi:hypothetical protein
LNNKTSESKNPMTNPKTFSRQLIRERYLKLSPVARDEVNQRVDEIYRSHVPEHMVNVKLDPRNPEHRPYVRDWLKTRDIVMSQKINKELEENARKPPSLYIRELSPSPRQDELSPQRASENIGEERQHVSRDDPMPLRPRGLEREACFKENFPEISTAVQNELEKNGYEASGLYYKKYTNRIYEIRGQVRKIAAKAVVDGIETRIYGSDWKDTRLGGFKPSTGKFLSPDLEKNDAVESTMGPVEILSLARLSVNLSRIALRGIARAAIKRASIGSGSDVLRDAVAPHLAREGIHYGYSPLPRVSREIAEIAPANLPKKIPRARALVDPLGKTQPLPRVTRTYPPVREPSTPKHPEVTAPPSEEEVTRRYFELWEKYKIKNPEFERLPVAERYKVWRELENEARKEVMKTKETSLKSLSSALEAEGALKAPEANLNPSNKQDGSLQSRDLTDGLLSNSASINIAESSTKNEIKSGEKLLVKSQKTETPEMSSTVPEITVKPYEKETDNANMEKLENRVHVLLRNDAQELFSYGIKWDTISKTVEGNLQAGFSERDTERILSVDREMLRFLDHVCGGKDEAVKALKKNEFNIDRAVVGALLPNAVKTEEARIGAELKNPKFKAGPITEGRMREKLTKSVTELRSFMSSEALPDKKIENAKFLGDANPDRDRESKRETAPKGEVSQQSLEQKQEVVEKAEAEKQKKTEKIAESSRSLG